MPKGKKPGIYLDVLPPQREATEDALDKIRKILLEGNYIWITEMTNLKPNDKGEYEILITANTNAAVQQVIDSFEDRGYTVTRRLVIPS